MKHEICLCHGAMKVHGMVPSVRENERTGAGFKSDEGGLRLSSVMVRKYSVRGWDIGNMFFD